MEILEAAEAELPELINRDETKKSKILINPQAPVAQKIADEVIFQRFQGEGVEFF